MEERFYLLTQKVFKKDPSEVTAEEVEAIAAQYPYFAPVHFIQLLQQSEGSDAYRQQYQKAILYYPDPSFFEQFLHEADDAGWNPSEVFQQEDESRFSEIALTPEPIQETYDEPIATEEEATTVADLPAIPEKADPEIEVPERVDETVPHEETKVEETIAPTENLVQETPIPAPPPPPTETSAAELTFEPYHTVDYFASQGIKITADSISQDKFGKQVKSFTDWLKTMKRLPLSELGKDITPTTEKKVENLAEHSVADADVVTESMAQVWEKQGNISKATEVYHKLSLQNPSKRAYFAAKIDKLTGEN